VIARIISRSIGRMGISVDRRLVLVLFFLPLFSVSLVFPSCIAFQALENICKEVFIIVV
jgi:hypothetical protein